MKRFQVLALSLFAVLAFSAVASSAAFALTFENAEFLKNAETIPAGTVLPATSTGKLLLEDTSTGGGVTCEGTFVGELTTEDFLVTEVLNKAGVKILELSGEGVLCTPDTGSACANETDIEAWPINLPWLFQPVLDNPDLTAWLLVFADGKGAPGWHVVCLVFGLKTESSCSAAEGSGGEATNVAGGIEGVEMIAEPLGKCGTGTENGVIEPLKGGLLSSTSGTLSISK